MRTRAFWIGGITMSWGVFLILAALLHAKGATMSTLEHGVISVGIGATLVVVGELFKNGGAQ